MKKTYTGVIAIAAATLLGLTACSGSGANGAGGDSGDEDRVISLSYTPGWSDGKSMTFLLKDQLEKLDYTVEVEEIGDLGPNYAAVANGDVDIHSSAWPEVTQATYMEEFGDDIESLGVWYDEAELFMAVPSYSQVNSLDELADNADLFDHEIIGMEPGAGLTTVVQDSMMPAYGLDDWDLRTSSTQSMLTVLGDKIDNKEEVIVNLWSPFWANTAYDIKPLEDPEDAMGVPEGLHVNATRGFGAEHADAAELIAGLKLDDESYGELEALIISEDYEDDPETAVDIWIEEHPEAFPTLIS
ncbi:glycine betaine ABC transporter substrate-binding protein [Leucobacter sp. GX24907]